MTAFQASTWVDDGWCHLLLIVDERWCQCDDYLWEDFVVGGK
jgi:hypothetical protein